MQILTSLVLLISFILSVNADVSITLPKAGSSFSGSGGSAAFTVSWVDSTSDDTDQFSLSNAKTFTISLCYGPSSAIAGCVLLMKNTALTKYTYDASIQSSAFPNGWYFVQVYTTFSDSSTTIQYSGYFQLTGMSGPSTITATATGAAPQAQTSVAGGAGTDVNSASFSMPYTEQTGRTKYAPMQTQPGSTITATTWAPRFPTSSVTYYLSASPSPNCHSTITPGWDYTATSEINMAAVAPYPTYFYPASSRVSKAQLQTAKKKRWL